MKIDWIMGINEEDELGMELVVYDGVWAEFILTKRDLPEKGKREKSKPDQIFAFGLEAARYLISMLAEGIEVAEVRLQRQAQRSELNEDYDKESNQTCQLGNAGCKCLHPTGPR